MAVGKFNGTVFCSNMFYWRSCYFVQMKFIEDQFEFIIDKKFVKEEQSNSSAVFLEIFDLIWIWFRRGKCISPVFLRGVLLNPDSGLAYDRDMWQ